MAKLWPDFSLSIITSQDNLVVARPLACGPQQPIKPVDNLPNPYQTGENYFKQPAGRTWGAISAIETDKDGQSIWIAERCGANSGCAANSSLDPILLFNASGKLVRSFGAGMILSPTAFTSAAKATCGSPITPITLNGPNTKRSEVRILSPDKNSPF
jgi:hypothetical protein